MPDTKDFYALLHIQPDAPPDLIKASYRTLMQKLKMHPDLGGNVAKASQINNAYAVLSDEELRAEYDRARTRQAPSPEQSQKPAEDSPASKRVMWSDDSTKQSLECLFCKATHALGAHPPLLSLCESCESPIAATNKRDLLPGERRTLERLQLERQMFFRAHPDDHYVQAKTSDLSLTGLRFQSDKPLVVNQLVQIRSQFCLALGRVAHSADNHQYGIEFVTLCFPNTSGSIVSERA